MSFRVLSCPVCGGTLEKELDLYLCSFCGCRCTDESAENAYHQLMDNLTDQFSSLLDERLRQEKEERFYSLRVNLLEKVSAKYIDSNAIIEICKEIKKIIPHDFMASFYEVANSSSTKNLVDFIRKIDVKEQYLFIEYILDFLLKSITTELVAPINYLIERAYKHTDLKLFEKYMNRLEEEAIKVDSGIYETSIPRDVFIAYASEDIDTVLELAGLLEENEISCFVAMRNLQHGIGAVDNYEKELQNAIDNCKIIVFVSSQYSRRIKRDALRLELPYVKKRDLENAPAGHKLNYTSMPAIYKKPRIEYRLDNLPTNAADYIIREFFNGLDYCETAKKVMERVTHYIVDNSTITHQKESVSLKNKLNKEQDSPIQNANPFKALTCPACGGNFSVSDLTDDDDFVTCSTCNKVYLTSDIFPKIGEYRAKKEAERKKISANTQQPYIPSQQSQTILPPQNHTPPSASDPFFTHQQIKYCNKWVTLFLCYFLGIFGVHKFYEGKKKMGKIYLFSFGLFGYGWLFDLFRTLFKPSRYPKQKK